MGIIRAIDMFCGAGGSSWGARAAGVQLTAAFDTWDLAGNVYKDNFPEARFFSGRLQDIREKTIKSLGKIDLIMASPECTNHSPAKGSKARCEKSRETAFQVTRFAKLLEPRWIVVENVVSMRNWPRYQELLSDLENIGYRVRPQVLNSADYRVPQRRRRLFLVCDSHRTPPQISPKQTKPLPARKFINTNGSYRYSDLRAPGRAQATLDRANRAIDALGRQSPFLIVYYGTDHAGGWGSTLTSITMTTSRLWRSWRRPLASSRSSRNTRNRPDGNCARERASFAPDSAQSGSIRDDSGQPQKRA